MIVVEVEDDRVERQSLVAAHGALASQVLEAVKPPIQPGTNRVRFFRVARQRVGTLVRRAERARAAFLREVFAEGLARAALGARGNRLGELELIFARYLMHRAPPAVRLVAFYAHRGASASVRKWAAARVSGCVRVA